MRTKLLFVIAGIFPLLLVAQPKLNQQPAMIRLATGNQQLQPISSKEALAEIKSGGSWNGYYIWLARFSAPPSGEEKLAWEKEGTKVLSRLDNQTYYIASNSVPNAEWLQQHRVLQTAVPNPLLKLDKSIAGGTFPAEAKDEGGRLTVLVAVQPQLPFTEIKSWLTKNDFTVETTPFEKESHILTLHVAIKKLGDLAALPFTVYIQPLRKDRVLNEKARLFTGGFLANAPLSSGGHNLNGKGMVVGVGDLGDGSIHPDLAGRIDNHSAGIINTHGAHVTGIIAGAGLLQPDRRGMAPLSTIISQYFSGIWQNAAQYFQDFGMVLTNNSYGNSDGKCPNTGEYDLYSNLIDQQAYDLPVLLNVFAVGNSGQEHCNPYLEHYNTTLSGFQSAKNIVTVGQSDFVQEPIIWSSSGPVNDGRLKPELMGLGIIQSTTETNDYVVYSGSSMSAPNVTGGLALLYERYRQLFGGQNPQGALMKAILLNGAKDVGNPGPDYRNGYGMMHLENSLRILDNHYYFGGSMATAGSKDSVVVVPAGVHQLKVMLYWHDPAALPLATQALVNDLDLEVVMPNGTIVYPKKLNPAIQHVADPATEGPDHLNNSEQVVIETPVAGNYTIRIKGYDVSGTPTQAYFATFDYISTGLRLRSPLAGDNWSVVDPTEYIITGVPISWDDEGTPSGGNYTLQYSLDAGNNWVTIPADTLNPAVPLVLKDTCRFYSWRPPGATNTNQAMVRISKNGTAFTSTSGMFTILNRPTSVAVTKSCEGYLSVSWKAVNGADDYEVIRKQGLQMVPVAVVKDALSYTIKGLSKDSTYYVGVRARKGGVAGRYLYARGYVPNGGGCTGTISDGDLKLDSITAPVSGRQFTSAALGAAENVKVRIKNLDNAAVAANSYQIKYSLDGGTYISQPGGAIPALGTYTHTFAGVDFSAAGTHTITAVVSNTTLVDSVPRNDTFRMVVKNLTNAVIAPTANLASSFIENFETAAAATYQANTVGITGLDRWDYFNHSIYDRARTFVQSGIALSGSKAITLDVSRQQADTPNNRLQGTFNLSGNSMADEVRLDFQYKQHGPFQKTDPKNKVWIRGDDKSAWIEVYDLGNNQPQAPGTWKLSKSIELNDVLAAAIPAQSISSSTQVRIGQTASVGMADNTHLAGYSFDDIRLYIATNDLQMVAIDEPAIYSCGLNNATPIKIIVRNSMATPAMGVQVSYTIDGGAAVTETIPVAIQGNTNYTYQFTATANFADYKKYVIAAAVNFDGDNVPDNNTATATIYNQPVISQYPYLEDFEADNGNYFTSGTLSSWQWGVPAATKIDTAASGKKVWKTSLAGNYNDNEMSYLNSPCFDLTSLANPTLSFSFAYDIEDCGTDICDSAWMEYSTDGISWKKLGAPAQGTNWYDDASKSIWRKQDRTYWHVATIPLPKAEGNLRFRFALSADQGTSYEGIAMDDIHVYDLAAPMYTQKGASNPVTQAVSGTAPINFSDGGKLIATVLPNNNNLGNTEVKAYIFDGPVRNNYGIQYYGNRNITIKPATNPNNSNVTVRFYFSDKEVDSMRLANTCATCTPIKDYTHLGVTQYTDPDKQYEDGSLDNNTDGTNRFIFGNNIRLVPYDSGYYAEYNVAEFSEFWLNDGRGDDIPLPSHWINIKASKQNGINGIIEWNTANETAIDYYEIEVTTSKQAADAGTFETIGKAFARNTGQASYSYSDERAGKNGDYYYRVKQVAKDGKVFYSPIRLLSFGKLQFNITLRPNPVKDNLWLAVQSEENKTLQVKIINIAGQTIYQQNWPITSGSSQLSIPVNKLALGKGVYTVGVGDGKSWWYGKVLKQ